MILALAGPVSRVGRIAVAEKLRMATHGPACGVVPQSAHAAFLARLRAQREINQIFLPMIPLSSIGSHRPAISCGSDG
jgi:hypothetical protein